MSGATFTLSVDDATVLLALDGLADAPSDLAPLWKAIGEDMVSSTKERFRTETDPEGRPWAPLNPLYAETKKGAGILKESGQLAWGIAWQIEGDALEWGTNRPHARVHQFGAVIKPKTAAALVFELGEKTIRVKSVTVPRRSFLGISEEDRRTILDTMADWLDAATGGALTGSPT